MEYIKLFSKSQQFTIRNYKSHYGFPTFTNHMFFLVTFILGLHVNRAGSIQHYATNIRQSNGSLYIQSRGFPSKSYYSGEAYTEVWNLSAENKNTYIQVYFEDFHISYKSFVKIVDVQGTSPNEQPNFVYGYNRRPLFQSAGNKLVIVFKTGQAHKKLKYNRGFRAKITWVPYTRNSWHSHGIPSIGYCGDIHVDGRSASVRFEPPPSVIKKYLFDCIWYISGGYMKISDIKLKFDPQRSGRQLNVFEKGHVEVKENAVYSYKKGGPSQSHVLVSSSQLFLVRLVTYMDAGDYVKIQFANSTSSLANSATPLDLTAGQPCPFNHYKYPDRCSEYWENPTGTDETCLYLPGDHSRCKAFKTTGVCTNPDYDGCDQYTDCRSGAEDEDEKYCHSNPDDIIPGSIVQLSNVSLQEMDY